MAAKQDKPAEETTKTEVIDEAEAKTDDRKVCGIVMPIAAMGDDYPEAHWGRVRRILQRAIDRAGLRSQLVWENPEVDVIQTAILQNLFENDVVICDVSNLNPNVMLETGLRLSTKRPTIIVTDRVKRPPFDISTIAYIDYPRDLEYNATEDFIAKLARKIGEVAKAAAEERYKPYIEQFRFETVQPDSVTVTTDEYVKERLDDLTASVRRLIRYQERATEPPPAERPAVAASVRPRVRHKLIGTLLADFDQEHAKRVEAEIDKIIGIYSSVSQVGESSFSFEIYMNPAAINSSSVESMLNTSKIIIHNAEADYALNQ